jgi:biopolymer transport protein ExbB/TolQ
MAIITIIFALAFFWVLISTLLGFAAIIVLGFLALLAVCAIGSGVAMYFRDKKQAKQEREQAQADAELERVREIGRQAGIRTAQKYREAGSPHPPAETEEERDARIHREVEARVNQIIAEVDAQVAAEKSAGDPGRFSAEAAIPNTEEAHA